MGAVHDGRILVHRGGEGSNPRMGRFYTDGCFGYTDTCGTVVFPLIYDYADSFSNGFAVVGKGEKNDRRFGLIDRQGVKSCPVSMRMSRVFRQALPGTGGDGFRPPLWVCRYAGTGRNSIEIRLCPDFSEGMAVVAKGEWSGKSGYGKGILNLPGNTDSSIVGVTK